MGKRNPWVAHKRPSNDEMDDMIKQFLANGGKIVKLNEDNGDYDKGLKKIENRLGGGFNPFSKEDALTKD